MKKNQPKLVASAAALICGLLLTTQVTAATQEGTAAPTFADATQGGQCDAEGTLSDFQAKNPLICTDGKWQKVAFKQLGEGVAAPLFYEGRCSYRFIEGNKTAGKITVKSGQLADICLPAKWKVIFAAGTNLVAWNVMNVPSVPNVVMVKAIGPSETTLWLYPESADGQAVDKVVVRLRATK